MDGQQLVSEFQEAVIGLATANAAELEANRTESDLIHHLQALSSGRFLQPAAINEHEQADITRTSLDAHFKKVQATQLSQMSAAQLHEKTDKAAKIYRGRRVQITVLPGAKDVIDLIMYDPQRGYRLSSSNRRIITGIIDEISFEKNALVLRPSLSIRMLNKNLKNYVVYIIDPQTFSPLVSLQLR
jgi:hypothetical protein